MNQAQLITNVYADGACSGNPGPGGWAYVTSDGISRSGSEKSTTNNRMELIAVLRAVEDIEGPLRIFSDSAYVVNCFLQGWWVKWQKKDWLKGGQLRINHDLWKPLVNAVQCRDIIFIKVKGHSGNPMNDRADWLAQQAARMQRVRSET